MISEKFGGNGVQLERNRHDNSCKIFSKSGNVNLKNFAPLLGFPANAVTPSNVDVNLGLRYVTVGCNCVDTDKNFDPAGKKEQSYRHGSHNFRAEPELHGNLLRGYLQRSLGG